MCPFCSLRPCNYHHFTGRPFGDQKKKKKCSAIFGWSAISQVFFFTSPSFFHFVSLAKRYLNLDGGKMYFPLPSISNLYIQRRPQNCLSFASHANLSPKWSERSSSSKIIHLKWTAMVQSWTYQSVQNLRIKLAHLASFFPFFLQLSDFALKLSECSTRKILCLEGTAMF